MYCTKNVFDSWKNKLGKLLIEVLFILWQDKLICGFFSWPKKSHKIQRSELKSQWRMKYLDPILAFGQILWRKKKHLTSFFPKISLICGDKNHT